MQNTIKSLLLQFLLPFCAVLFIAFPVFSQSSPEEAAKKYNITFPVIELGNCVDFSSCRTYCDDPINRIVCIDFAKKKGFYKEAPIEGKKEIVIAAAKKELGCDSETSCREFCSISENFDICEAFAQKNGLQTEPARDPGQPEILTKAKALLNCDSEQSCKIICEIEENKEKCSSFAKQAGIRGGEHRVGPGGCISEETCKAFCLKSENAKECGFAPRPSGVGPSGFIADPAGCNSEESCRVYCEKNPQECQKNNIRERKIDVAKPFGGSATGSGKPTDNVAPSKEEYCRLYPARCRPSGFEVKPTSQGVAPTLNQTQTEYKAAYMACAKNPGCLWTSSGCNCSNSQGDKNSLYPKSAVVTPYKTSDQYQPSPASETPENNTYTKPDGSISTEVKGSFTNESLIQKVLNFFLTLQ